MKLIDADKLEMNVMGSKVFTQYFKELVQALIWGEDEVRVDSRIEFLTAENAELKQQFADTQERLARAIFDCSRYCETCAFVNDCAKHDNNDAAPPTWYYGDCDDWQWRGTEESK